MNGNNSHKNKGGRPRKSDSERKNRKIAVCFSEQEYLAIKEKASQTKLSLSEYCHSAVMVGKIVEPINKEDMQILKSLSQMGNNLNQFVKVSRFNNMREMEMAAVYLLELMRNIIAKLSDDWKSYKRKKL